MDDSQAPESQERYEIRSKIGEGGIGAVYLAYDTSLKREVAIKRLLPQGEKPEEERYHAEEIVREAGLLSKLQHPNIVTVYDAGIDDDGGFVVMEYIDGETVDETLKRGALTYGDFRMVVEQALEGLIAAQDVDMLHRDIKPSNVMIRWLPSGKFQLKLLDFGLARVTQRPALQTVRHGDSILGSIYFMAPEQLEREPLDGRTDLYSLGCLFYYMLTGTYPFDGESGGEVMVKKLEHDISHLSKLRPDIPISVCDWVMRMLAREREERPDSAQTALEEFDAAATRAEEQLAKLNHNPLLAPALAGSARTPALRTITEPAGAAPHITGAVPPHTTSYYMQRPTGAKNGNAGVTVAAVASVLLCGAVGGWVLFGQKKDAPLPPGSTSAEYDGSDSNTDSTEDEPPPDPGPSTPNPDPNRVEIPEVTTLPRPEDSQLSALVPLGSVWKYWDQGGVPARIWRNIDYLDDDWPEGPAPIGYGEKKGVLTTEIGFGGDRKNKHMSSLFRHTFTAPENHRFAALWLRYQVDDACVVYLNGEEISRVGMGDKKWPGPSQKSKRKADSPSRETEFFQFRIDRITKLKAGENTLSVRVHQVSKTSSDIRLDLELAGEN